MFGVLVPVGPDPRDVRRLAALIAELHTYEVPEDIRLIVVDDAPAARDFSTDWPGVVVVRTPLWAEGPPDSLSAHVAGTLTGLEAAADLEFVVKLDTDAAVIRPFSAQLREIFHDSGLGIVGSYDLASDGGRRDWSLWKRLIDHADRPFTLSRARGRLEVWRRTALQREAVRRLRRAAYRFAPPGAHCLGGAYAVSGSLISSAALDWRPWIRTRLGEDVVIGLLSSAAQLRMQNLNRAGEPFCVAWRGLAASPAEIVAAGHCIVHSVKRDTDASETALRSQFRTLVASERAHH